MSKPKHNIGPYTTIQAAELVGVSPQRIRQLAKENLISSQKFGRLLMITDEGIAQAMARNTKPGPVVETSGSKAK